MHLLLSNNYFQVIVEMITVILYYPMSIKTENNLAELFLQFLYWMPKWISCWARWVHGVDSTLRPPTNVTSDDSVSSTSCVSEEVDTGVCILTHKNMFFLLFFLIIKWVVSSCLSYAEIWWNGPNAEIWCTCEKIRQMKRMILILIVWSHQSIHAQLLDI